MLKSLLFSGAALAALLVVSGQAQARGRHNSCGCTSAPVAAAPATQTAAAPASGYRTYSYQPGMTTATSTARYSNTRSVNTSGVHRAGWKIIGD